MKKYVPVKLKWFVLLFRNRATHILRQISDENNERWGNNCNRNQIKNAKGLLQSTS